MISCVTIENEGYYFTKYWFLKSYELKTLKININMASFFVHLSQKNALNDNIFY